MGRFALNLGLLTTAVGYAVVMDGGDGRVEVSLALLVLAVAAISGSLWRPDDRPQSLPERLISVAAIAFPVYVACQLIPLPLGILGVLSPARAELASALGGIMAAPSAAPLSISPANTWIQLSRITACAMVFLIARRLAGQSKNNAWIPVAPLLAIGGLEAALGVAQWTAGATSVTGTYLNRNHFAGLLEMTLPITVMSGIAFLSARSDRRRAPEPVGVPAAITASLLLAVACAVLLATMLSLSKTGIIATLGSLFFTGALYVGTADLGWRRWPLIAGLGVVAIGVFLFLTPPELAERFGSLAADDPSEGRLPIARDALRLAAAYPLFGSGLGNFYPAITRYQTSGFNVAWVNAHNDYLQLLSELGIVGWMIPAILLTLVFRTALQAARAASSVDVRCFGLGCVGAMSAILLHSFADFNMYVFANAMVLSWIAGVASALVPGPAPGARAVRPRTNTLSIGKPLLVLGAFAGIYATGSLVFLQRFRGDPAMERVFCRFGICDTEGARGALGRQRVGEQAVEPTAAELLEYLPRDPAAADLWNDVGTAMQKAGQTAAARYSFGRSIVLAPGSPPILLMAASFHFDVGEHRQAFDLMSRSLQSGSQFDEAAFGDLEIRRISVEEILAAGMLDRRSSPAYLRELISTGNVEYAEKTWPWLVQRGFADDTLARRHIDFLVDAKKAEEAFKAWALYAGERSPGYPESNPIFNGSFESDPTGCRFDWKLEVTAGAAIDFDPGVARSGSRSLRVQFDATANPTELGLRQEVFLEPGRYRLRGYIRTNDVSTDEGVGLRVVSGEGTAPIDAATEKLRGTNDWTLVEGVFDAPAGGGLVRVSLARKATLKFDNRLRGAVWIDQVSISEEKN